MPAWSQLSDEQIAAVLNHVLASWDNAGRVEELPYGAADVPGARTRDADQVYAARGSWVWRVRGWRGTRPRRRT